MLHQLGITLGATLLFFPVFILSLHVGLAQVMESNNYLILSDSINVGGGYSSSSDFQMEATVGEVATGDSGSDSFELRAGFQQMQETYLSLTGGQAVVLGPTIPGVSGGTATGSTTVLVTTDSFGGYELRIEAEEDPAMRSGVNTIADYTPAGSVPDYTFETGLADAHLGFTPEGLDIAARFKDETGVCGSGRDDTADRCWDGLSTTPSLIARSQSSNHPEGATTTIKFQVGVGGSVVQAAGTYVATTTITAIAL